MEVDNQKAKKFLTDFSENYYNLKKNFWHKRNNPEENQTLNGVRLLSSIDFHTKKNIMEASKPPRKSFENSPKKRESSARITPKDREKFKNLVNLAAYLDSSKKLTETIEGDEEEFEELYKEFEDENSQTDVHFSPFKIVASGPDSSTFNTPLFHKKKKLKALINERKIDSKCYDIGRFY